MGLGPAQSYLAKYNGYVLPGYVQRESMDSSSNMAEHYAPYADGSDSEYTGMRNKILSLTLKVWEEDFLSCKQQIANAATIVRSRRSGFAPLYVQYSDRHYDALTTSIKYDKSVPSSVKLTDYQVDFECAPWLIDDATKTLTGTGTVTTDQVARTIVDGGWTPAKITVTGTNVTISGYTDTGEFAGYASITGSVSSLVIDSDAFTATQGGVNKNDIMAWADYRISIGPGKTFLVTTGASSMTVTYNNRWYL
jgi:hypothetical protein